MSKPTQADKSYRYLRLGMLLTTLSLAISLMIEIGRSGEVLGSISAYYYSPVRPLFVGALFVIGVSLVALAGREPLEDLVLNLAGFFAPIVAIVPIRPEASDDVELALLEREVGLSIPNSAISLFLGFSGALVLALWLERRKPGTDGATSVASASRRWTEIPRWSRTGMVMSTLVLAAGVGWFLAARSSFDARAHYVAAFGMFGSIWVAVLVNASPAWFAPIKKKLDKWLGEPTTPERSGRHRNFYLWVAGLMALSSVVLIPAIQLGLPHGVLILEAILIVLFGAFWFVQTMADEKSDKRAGESAE